MRIPYYFWNPLFTSPSTNISNESLLGANPYNKDGNQIGDHTTLGNEQSIVMNSKDTSKKQLNLVKIFFFKLYLYSLFMYMQRKLSEIMKYLIYSLHYSIRVHNVIGEQVKDHRSIKTIEKYIKDLLTDTQLNISTVG